MRVLILGLCCCSSLTASLRGADEMPLRHAYYLTVKAADKYEETSYIPLLVTRTPLTSATDNEAVVIITYKRDSIWELKSERAPIAKDEIRAGTQTLFFQEKFYRYQEVDAAEVLKLLNNPYGRIPISRLKAPIGESDKALAQELQRDLAAMEKK